MAYKKVLDPIHPGEILFEEFMRHMEVSINQLARNIGGPLGRISAIVNGKRSITADTALRLAKYFGPFSNSGLDFRVSTISESHDRTEIKKRIQQHVA